MTLPFLRPLLLPADQNKKINIYNQMAQLLVGHDVTGNIRQFDQDGDLTGGNKMKEVFFINFARLLNKDEIKKGTVSLQFYDRRNHQCKTWGKTCKQLLITTHKMNLESTPLLVSMVFFIRRLQHQTQLLVLGTFIIKLESLF